MATFVLVHGSFHGGWCWDGVAERLRAAGHAVFAPTLTGLGERSHLLSPEVDLDTHIADIAGVIAWQDLHDIVLVGHSYGGMVTTGVCDRLSDRIAVHVCLDALVPSDGDTVMGLLQPGTVAAFREGALRLGGGWRVPPAPASRYGVTDPDDAARVDRLCTPHPLASYEQPIRLGGGEDRVPVRIYVLAEAYLGSVMQDIAADLARRPGWVVRSLPTGHDMMIAMPDAVADLLLEAAPA